MCFFLFLKKNVLLHFIEEIFIHNKMDAFQMYRLMGFDTGYTAIKIQPLPSCLRQ